MVRVVRFFKIMFGENITKYMYLPVAFAREVSHLTNKEFPIEDASGQRCLVTLSHINRSLAFQKGWPEFIEEHGVKGGELLVFSYHGSHFTVQIYSKSTLEKTSFNNEKRQPIKKRKKIRGTFLEDEPYQTADVNSGDNTISAALFPPGNEFQRRKTNNAMVNAGFEVSQPLPIAVNIEDPLCVFSRDDGCHEERRNHLFDLSCYEMENGTSDANKFQIGLITELDNSHTETAQHDVTKNASDTKRSLSSIGIVEPTKPAGDDAMEQSRTTMEGAAVIETDVIMGDSVNISIDESVADTQMTPHAGNDHFAALHSASPSIGGCKIAERELVVKSKFNNPLGQHSIKKECVMKVNPEMAHQITKKVDDTQMSPHSGQSNGHSRDAFANKSYEKPSDNSNIKKGKLDYVCNSLEGSGKIAEREHALQSKFAKSIASSAAVKHPLGQHSIKKECVMKVNPEMAHQITKKVDDTQMSPHSGQSNGHSRDAFANKSYEKPSDNSNIKKGKLDYVCNSLEGCVKIAEREHALQSKFAKSIVSSAAVKHPLGGHPITIKEEQVENVYNQVSSGGKGKPVLRKQAPVIKVEPGTVPSDTIRSSLYRPFSAEVKSTLYLDLPVQILGSGRGISLGHQWRMAVFLRGPSGRLWPVIYQECTGGRGFTNNWSKFCKENNINPGDECKFTTVKDDAGVCIYQVDVARVAVQLNVNDDTMRIS